MGPSRRSSPECILCHNCGGRLPDGPHTGTCARCGVIVSYGGAVIEVSGADAEEVRSVVQYVATMLWAKGENYGRRELEQTAGPRGEPVSAARFHSLKEKLTDLAADLDCLDRLLDMDVPSALNKIRFITEKVLIALAVGRNVSWGQAEPTVERLVGPLLAAGCIPRDVAIHLRTIQGNTSPGSHPQSPPLSAAHVRIARTALLEFLEWFARAA